MAFVAALMWLAAQVMPAAGLPIPARQVFALGMAAVGAGVAVAGIASFRLAKTTVNPLKP